VSFDAGAVIGQMILSHKEMGKALTAIKKDFKTFGKDTEKEVDKVDKTWDKFKKGLAKLGLAAIGWKIARFVSDAVQQFARLEQSTTAVNNLLEKYGKTWDDVYADMKAASGGMVSEMELLTQTGMGLSLGLDPETLVKMMDIARSTAQAMGKDVSYMFESLVTGTARQSKLWLDNLGIIINTEEAYKKYAATIHKSASQLTDFEKKQAFTNEVLEKGDALMKRIGRSGVTWAEVIQQGKTAIKDLTTAIGGLLSSSGTLKKVVQGWVIQFQSLAGWIREVVNNMKAMPLTKESVDVAERIEDLKKRKEYAEGRKESAWTEGTEKYWQKQIDQITKELEEKEKRFKTLRDAIKERQEENKNANTEDTTTTGGGDGGSRAEQLREDALQEMDALKEQTMSEKELLYKHYEDRMSMFEEANLSEEEMRNARLLAEQVFMQEYDRLRQADLEKERQAKQEEYNINKAANDRMLAAMEAKKKAREADIAAYTKSARLGIQLAIGETALLSKIFAGFEIAEATKEFAKFLGTKDPSHLVSSLEHALAAKQYLASAKGASGGGGGGGGGGAYAGAGGAGGGAGAGAGAGGGAGGGAISEEDRKPMGPPLNLQVHIHGAVLDGDKLQEWLVNDFSPQVDKLVNAGRITQMWSRQ